MAENKAYDINKFANETHVSRETLAQYQTWLDLLQKWNAKINLVSSETINQYWLRHALDSWQITKYIPKPAQIILDFGSGAGFPGIAGAIELQNRGAGQVILLESVGKKANFLRTVIRQLNLPATVKSERIEETTSIPADVITARAFAPLEKLLNYAQAFWQENTLGLFHKGENIHKELTQAQKTWHFEYELIPSLAAECSYIVKIQELRLKA